MEVNQFIGVVVSSVLTSIFYIIIKRQANLKTQSTEFITVYKPISAYLIVGLICLFISFTPIMVVVLTRDFEALIPATFIFVLFGFLATACLLVYINHYVIISDNKLQVTSSMGKMTEINIESIKNIKLNSLSGYYIIKSEKATVKIAQYISGINKILQTIKAS